LNHCKENVEMFTNSRLTDLSSLILKVVGEANDIYLKDPRSLRFVTSDSYD